MATGKSGTLEFYSSDYSYASYRGAAFKVDWSETYDISGNYSDVTFSNWRFQYISGWNSSWIGGKMLCNGTQVIASTIEQGGWGGYLGDGGDRDIFAHMPNPSSPITIRVAHDADGKKTASVSIERYSSDYSNNFYMYNTGVSASRNFAAQSKSIILTDIPRGIVNIYNSGWKKHQCYIYNGSNWGMYAPYIWNGSQWVLYGGS